ncbi:WD40 repeat domain-containing protein [Nostoc sp. 106C]|uniref:WD40 repeat domain-containing protein n=1 Tax=Nostoc sp. 106C TaxID=1932667 RepID=UPI000A3687B4|nr:WD40 repeat domain-containing protein [Nostoc sp. 106C]OUL26167.1 hypothetical protein BV375_21800 [Nostoc sp. 106C]
MGEFANKLAAQSPAFQRAYLGSLASSLVKSGNLEKYSQTLADFDFINAKLNHPEFGVQLLIEDYDLIHMSEVLKNPAIDQEQIRALKLIQGTLRLSAHILTQDKTQLAVQLWGRMQCFELPEIQKILEVAKQSQTSWLHPLTASLTRPGGRLLRTIDHSGEVTAVTVTPNSEKVISASIEKTLKVDKLRG